MDTKSKLKIPSRDDASAGAIPEVETDGAIMLFGALVVAVCFASPLLLTLPQTLDAAASPAPMIREMVASEPTFHERYPVQGGADWVDTLEVSE